MVYVELDAAFRVARAVTGSETLANAVRRYMTPERLIDVVRCRECIRADEYGHCEMQTFWGTRDDYCSRGRRREDGDNDV